MTLAPGYDAILARIIDLLETARRTSARSVNAIMTTTYWEIGRQIVEEEQGGGERAGYGETLIIRLSDDLTTRYGKGFSERNLQYMRRFFLAWPIPQTLSAESRSPGGGDTLTPANVPPSDLPTIEIPQTLPAECLPPPRFPLPWSHYLKLLTIQDPDARSFYETESLRGGWTVRQLDRQISSKFYERTLLSRNKAAMLRKGRKPQPADVLRPEEEIRDPLVLEFLGLKDEYSETELEEALILHLESFLLELGGDFAFVGRQRRLRIGNAWYRIDLLFFHRRLRCLVVIDLKLGEFTHADAGQMHLYLNYAREHWMHEHENPPVGLILCSKKDSAVAHYALEGLSNQVLASEYRMILPEEKALIAELHRTQAMLEKRGRHLPP